MVDFPYLIAHGVMDDTIWYYSPVLPSMLDSITMHNPLPSSTKGGFELNTQNIPLEIRPERLGPTKV